jgi:hypothetical protein
MKKHLLHKNTIIILIIIGCICIALNVVMYNALDTNKRDTEKRFTFNELILEHKNETFKELIEKAIEIDGIINEITFRNNKYTLILSEKRYNTLVLCEMQTDQNQKMEILHVGEKVKIKGVLKGVLMDVIVLNCIILEKEIYE